MASSLTGPRVAWTDRRWWAAAALLLVALGAAALVARAAYSDHDVHSVLVGHAHADVSRTVTDRNDTQLGLAIGLAAVGTGTAVALVAPGGARLQRLRYALLASALVVAAAVGTSLLTLGSFAGPPSRGVLSRTSFRSTSGFAAAMEASGLACADTRSAPIIDPSARAMVCSVPWNADIRDGHDDVFVAVWSSGEPGDWLVDNVARDVPAIAGEDWIATCEFRSTCALIGDRLHEVGR